MDPEKSDLPRPVVWALELLKKAVRGFLKLFRQGQKKEKLPTTFDLGKGDVPPREEVHDDRVKKQK